MLSHVLRNLIERVGFARDALLGLHGWGWSSDRLRCGRARLILLWFFTSRLRWLTRALIRWNLWLLLHWVAVLHGKVDLWVTALSCCSLLSRQQYFHHSKLLVLLLSHSHELLPLHPTGLCLHARVDLVLFLFEIFKVGKFTAQVCSDNFVCLLVKDSLNTASFHQL